VRYLLFVVVVVLETHRVAAQEKVGTNHAKALSFEVGIAHSRAIDEGLSYSKLLFTGFGVPILVQYASSNTVSATRVWVEFSNSKLFSDHGHVPATLLYGTLALDHARRLWDYRVLGKGSILMAGAKLSTEINYFDAPALDNEDVLSVSAIHLVVRTKITLSSRLTMVVQLDLPTIGFIKRVVFDGGLHEPANGELTDLEIMYQGSKIDFANTYAFKADIDYTLSRSVIWVTAYRLSYVRNDMIEPVRLYRNEIRTGFMFKF
jgi:hypothetical protein